MLRVQRPIGAKQKKVKSFRKPMPSPFVDLPPELGELITGHLDARSLCSLASVSRLLNQQTVACPRWEQLFRETFGPVTQLHIEAQALAGGWKQLYASKVAKKQLCPSEWEVKAFLEGLAACGAKDGIAVCALLDGSGSMGKGDFESMTGFVEQMASTLAELPNSQVSVIQFSSEAKVEIKMQEAATLDCAAALKSVSRMGSSTNFIDAFDTAAKETRSLAPEVARIIVLMSDFRVDDYSAKEAVSSAFAVAKEQPNTAIFALGVGRYVDQSLVTSVLQTGVQGSCPTRFISLGYQADSPDDDY